MRIETVHVFVHLPPHKGLHGSYIHSTDKSTAQKLLDIAHSWESDYGMKLASARCLVLSKQKNLYKIGENQLPEVNEATYLGIPLNMNGFDEKKLSAK